MRGPAVGLAVTACDGHSKVHTTSGVVLVVVCSHAGEDATLERAMQAGPSDCCHLRLVKVCISSQACLSFSQTCEKRLLILYSCVAVCSACGATTAAACWTAVL